MTRIDLQWIPTAVFTIPSFAFHAKFSSVLGVSSHVGLGTPELQIFPLFHTEARWFAQSKEFGITILVPSRNSAKKRPRLSLLNIPPSSADESPRVSTIFAVDNIVLLYGVKLRCSHVIENYSQTRTLSRQLDQTLFRFLIAVPHPAKLF